MKRAFDIFEMITSLVTSKSESPTLEDPTLYHVKTHQHEYAGKILFQDSVLIKLKINEEKVVKILKENIKKITIQKEATVNFN